jgi:hypothetical protein
MRHCLPLTIAKQRRGSYIATENAMKMIPAAVRQPYIFDKAQEKKSPASAYPMHPDDPMMTL